MSAAEEEKTARALLAAWLRPERGRAGDSEPPSDVDVKGELAAPGANAAKAINDEPRKPREPVGDRRTTEAPPKNKKEDAQENAEKRYKAEVVEKRRRTSHSLENVQKQLSSSRVRQASADRRWAWPAGNPKLPPKPTLEDEPEPVHHLREYSNYLSPRLGLSSLDTWTMASVYLGNLFLNQFILLPLMLAVITLPRLLLPLFTHSTSQPMVTLARGWLVRHDGWPVLAVLFPLIITTFIAPSSSTFTRWIFRRLHPWKVGLTILMVLSLGMTALTIGFTTQILPSLVASESRGMVRTLVRLELTVLLLLVLAAVIGRKSVVTRAESVAKGPYHQIWGRVIISILILGLASLASWLRPSVLDHVEPFMRWLTGDLAMFLGTFVMAWLGFLWTYGTVVQIRESRWPLTDRPHDQT